MVVILGFYHSGVNTYNLYMDSITKLVFAYDLFCRKR